MLRQLTRIVAFSMIVVVSVPRQASSQTGDFNGDTVLDCQDMNLLDADIRAGTNTPLFDLNGDQQVDATDAFNWRIEAGAELGDANLDRRVDHVDLNIVGINWRSTSAGFCQGDFSGDQFVSTTDDEYISVNWSPAPDYAANVISHDLPSALDAWRGSGVVFAETEHFELVSIPQSAPDGLLATVLAVRAKNPTDRIVTLRQLSFLGDLHQVGVEFPTGILTTPIIDDFFRPVPLPDDWRPADSHELLGIYDVGAMFIGPAAMDEDNDLTNPVGLDAQLSSFTFGPAVTGIGDIRGTIPEHAFSLVTLLQGREVALGQLVTPAIMSSTGERGEVFVRVGILGADESNESLPDEGVVGLDEPVRIPFFSEPCDFDADGRCDIVDVDSLLAALGTSNTVFDLQEDGTIDLNDRDEWLNLAGDESLLGEPFVLGDTDLNGTVDAADLNRIGLNWLSTDDSLLWSGGDFNGDYVVNAADLNALGLNWLHGEAAGPVRTVPEPGAWKVFLIVFFIIERRWRYTKRG